MDGVVTDDGSDVSGVLDGGTPVATAVFSSTPSSTSAWVSVYVAVHVTCAPGASDAAPDGQEGTGAEPVPENDVSVTVMSVSVTLPVFVTTNEYVSSCPDVYESGSDGEACFASEMPGAASTVTVADDGVELRAGPVGGRPDATAVFDTEPSSTSACVSTYEAVHVTAAPGASVVAGQVAEGAVPVPENAVSVTPTPVRVTLPVLLIRYE